MSEDTKIVDVARYILDKLGAISTMKLQKLCYYSQLWHCHITSKRLFDEDFQAWTYGPVSYELFQHHRGKYKVGSSDFSFGDTTRVSVLSREIIDQVLDVYGKFTGEQLSKLSHSESPWIESRIESQPGQENAIISIERMKDFAAASNVTK